MDTFIASVNPLIRCMLLLGMWAFVGFHKVSIVGALFCCFVVEVSGEIVCSGAFAKEDSSTIKTVYVFVCSTNEAMRIVNIVDASNGGRGNRDGR